MLYLYIVFFIYGLWPENKVIIIIIAIIIIAIIIAIIIIIICLCYVRENGLMRNQSV